MTQEEKAKAYDEALERAQKATRAASDVAMDIVQYIFPELAESEDERIRKWIVNLLHELHYNQTAHPMALKAIEWLEKQKGPVVDKEGMYYYLGGKFIYCGYPATEENPYDFAMSQQEKQKEQKPVETSDFKTKLAEYLQNNSPKDGQYVISSESILEMAEEELIKRGVVQKPVEWNEEDEETLEKLHRLLVICRGEKKFI